MSTIDGLPAHVPLVHAVVVLVALVASLVARAAVAPLAVPVAAGSVVTVYRIVESGARAAWTGRLGERAGLPPDAPGVDHVLGAGAPGDRAG